MKTIFFDMQGTIIENGVFPSPVKQIKYILNIRMDFPTYIQELEKTLMTGSYKELKEAFSSIGDAFDARITDEQMERLIGMWNKNKLLSKPYKGVFDILKELSKNYNLYMFANCDVFSKDIVDKYELKKYFKDVFLSFKEKALKKDILKKQLKKIKLKPEDILVVGDSIKSDMDSARNINAKSLLIDRTGRRDYEPKVSDMKEALAWIKDNF
ncbi:HAD family hydrolase [Candidatus Woesearchaeota archaeon]|nr:HAD family hydrolase [Candidatus Woesearchaeota archaeon]